MSGVVLRRPGCKCRREIGDSICPIHPQGHECDDSKAKEVSLDARIAELEATLTESRLDGIDDAIACVRTRLAYYELYLEPGPMQTRPEMFAAFAEMLIMLQAMRGRLARKESP